MKTLKLFAVMLISAGLLFFFSCDKKSSDENSGITVTISSPDNGSTYNMLDKITFVGNASDEQDGTLTGNTLTWSSNIDGELGTGTEISIYLSPGTHTVTLLATDSDANEKSAKINVTVNLPVLGACTYDLNGTWNFTTSNATHTGICPAGTNSSGTCEISQTANLLTLVFTSGWVCDPVSMCTYEGFCSGNTYGFANSDVVDDEGGVATNTISLTASSENTLSGVSASTYVLEDFVCAWGYDVVFTRAD
ncbi:MAG: hypothetical protein JXJ22_00505 [Bacteroidales bacterium]|nr:hypothetical protein [Bacteroidales bacterium]